MIELKYVNIKLYNDVYIKSLSCKWIPYREFRTSCLNWFVNIITFPLDAVKYLFCKSIYFIFYEVWIILWNSPYILYYGLYDILKRLDDYLSPLPNVPNENVIN
jgi:hypothetical protein